MNSKIEVLMNGGSLKHRVKEELDPERLFETEEDFFSILLMPGCPVKEDGEILTPRIPKGEMEVLFRETAMGCFADHACPEALQALMEDFFSGEEQRAGERISDFLWQSMSFDGCSRDDYRAFLTSLFAGRGFTVKRSQDLSGGFL